MERNIAQLDRVSADELDPRVKPFWKPSELHRLGLGSHQTVLAAIERKEIHALRVGRKILVPTAWLRAQMYLPEIVLGLDES